MSNLCDQSLALEHDTYLSSENRRILRIGFGSFNNALYVRNVDIYDDSMLIVFLDDILRVRLLSGQFN